MSNVSQVKANLSLAQPYLDDIYEILAEASSQSLAVDLQNCIRPAGSMVKLVENLSAFVPKISADRAESFNEVKCQYQAARGIYA